jgi:hypothetical protein
MIKSALCAAALTLVASASMAATTVDVTFTDADFSYYSGSFVATDTNNDGIIEINEVTDFTTALGSSTLKYFGDYDIATNTWSTTTDAGYYYYATLGSHTLALTTGDEILTTEETIVSSVPEPGKTSMLALGALAIFALRARNARRSV